RIGDPRVPSLPRRQERPTAAADFEHPNEAALLPSRFAAMVDEGHHARLIIVPRPQFPAVVAEPAQGPGEKRRGGEPALHPRPALGLPLGGSVRNLSGESHRLSSVSPDDARLHWN